MRLRASGKASPWRCLFLCLLLVSLQAEADCSTDRVDELATVDFIADGDTVKLASGKWVRLIGVNTPETGHRKGTASEPLADAARAHLEKLIGPEKRIKLRYGNDRQDRHGRLLAHAFLPDGSNISEQLIQHGLGFHVVVPPNTWSMACYQAAEKRAQDERLGVWSLGWFSPRNARELPAGASGFMRVRGKVVRIGRSKNTSWINLEGRVALRLADKDRPAFSAIDLQALAGKTLTVRGWFYRSNSRHDDLRTNLRHPAAIESVN